MRINIPFSQQGPLNEKPFSVALALAGLLDREAFKAAHRHIVATVETPPPRLLYPEWLPLSRRRQHSTYPLWYKAYKKAIDTYLALKLARDELEEVLKEADTYAYYFRRRGGSRYEHQTDRDIVLYSYRREGPSDGWAFRWLQFKYEDRKAEVEKQYAIHQRALQALNVIFQCPDDAVLQILSFICPMCICTTLDLATLIKYPKAKAVLGMNALQWEVQGNRAPPKTIDCKFTSQKEAYISLLRHKFSDARQYEVATFAPPKTNDCKFTSQNEARTSRKRYKVAFASLMAKELAATRASTPAVPVRPRTRSRVDHSVKLRASCWRTRQTCPFRWGDINEEDDSDSDEEVERIDDSKQPVSRMVRSVTRSESL